MHSKYALIGKTLKLVGFGFVDNTVLVKLYSSADDIIELACRLQGYISWWEAGANASIGGCFMDVTCDGGYWDYSTPSDKYTLSLKESNGDRVKIDILKLMEAKNGSSIFSGRQEWW